MPEIIPIPAFDDNYIWLLHHDGHAIVVDPGDAQPVLDVLIRLNLHLDAILVTHHHADHIGGVEALIAATSAQAYAPKKERYVFPHEAVSAGDQLEFASLGLSLSVFDIPGHTLGHVAYYAQGILFCGDTLFGAGCGRLFEGTPSQMLASLQRLASLPGDTAVYCAHEYTQHNLRFALSLEPDHAALQARAEATGTLRAQGLPSLPSSIGLELATNPFLRCHEPGLAQASGSKDRDVLSVFTSIRDLRNHF